MVTREPDTNNEYPGTVDSNSSVTRVTLLKELTVELS
jgi:hypothetical protein